MPWGNNAFWLPQQSNYPDSLQTLALHQDANDLVDPPLFHPKGLAELCWKTYLLGLERRELLNAQQAYLFSLLWQLRRFTGQGLKDEKPWKNVLLSVKFTIPDYLEVGVSGWKSTLMFLFCCHLLLLLRDDRANMVKGKLFSCTRT